MRFGAQKQAGVLSTYVRAAAIGAATGMRAMFGLGLLAQAAAHPGFDGDGDWTLQILRRKRVRDALRSLALGEWAGDKLPFLPSSVQPTPLLGRLFLGALSGACVAAAGRRSRAVGAVVGSLAAAGSAMVGQKMQETLQTCRGGSYVSRALFADVVVAGLGAAALGRALLPSK